MVYGETPVPGSALGPVRPVRHQRRSGEYHWGRAAIQVAFTIFVLTETWLVPLEGYLIDKFGPRVMIAGSGVLVAIAWANRLKRCHERN